MRFPAIPLTIFSFRAKLQSLSLVFILGFCRCFDAREVSCLTLRSFAFPKMGLFCFQWFPHSFALSGGGGVQTISLLRPSLLLIPEAPMIFRL